MTNQKAKEAMNNNVLRILFIFIILTGCSESKTNQKRNEPTSIITDSLKSTSTNDALKKNIEEKVVENKRESRDQLQKYFYPNMSYCGGAVYGFYRGNELVRIESHYAAELGYSSRDVDFENGKVVRINYREYFAEWEKYRQRYPSNDEFEEKHMTYSDTVYLLEFGKENSFKQFAGKKLISTKVRQKLVDRLLSCVETMKDELAREKELVREK